MPPTATLDETSAPADGARENQAEKKAGRGSLKPVLDVIPPEAYDNPTWKGLWYFGRDLALYLAASVALVLVANPLIAVPLIVLSGLAISGLFVVAHDAAHGALFKSKRLCSVVGHVAMLPSAHVYEGWVLGHNRVHHGYTVREGFDFVWHPYTPEQYAEMGRFARLRHRAEWSWWGAGLYFIREVWWNRMIVGDPPARWRSQIRRDRAFVFVGWGLATALLVGLGVAWGLGVLGTAWLVARVLLLPFLVFMYTIGSFVHVHHVQPDIRWWRRREWTKWKGQVEGTTVLRTSKAFDFFVHWIMVHTPHHVDVRIPMYNLELAAAAIEEAFPGEVHDEPLRFRDFMANTRRCRLYDFDAGEWLTYEQARERLAGQRTT